MPEPKNIPSAVEKPLPLQAIVIGSGFGGAVTACRLSQAGFKVLVLERGRRYGASDFPALPKQPSLLPDMRRWRWATDQGLWDVRDLGDVIAVQAAGYGGGSLVYANVHLRPPAEVFSSPPWPEIYADGAILEKYYDLVAAMLDVAPITSSPKLSECTPKRAGLEAAAAGLGRSDDFFHPPLAVSYEDPPNQVNRFGAPQRACIGCGACCTGCPVGAKNTLDLNYLAVAERNGVEVRTQTEVTGIERRSDGTWQVTVTDHLEARTLVFNTPYLFLCAGSVHSTELLARAKLGECGLEPKNVGTGYFPGADALGVVYDTEKSLEPSSGPAITTSTVHWQTLQPLSYFMIQDGGYASELERILGFMRASVWLGRNQHTQSSTANGQAPVSGEAEHDPPAGPRLQSPLDDLLDAVRNGAFADTISDEQRATVRGFFEQAKGLLALPQIVRSTLERNVSSRYAANWPSNLLDPKKWPAPKLRELEHRMMAWWCGGDDKLADNALDTLLALSDRTLSDLLRDLLGYSAHGASNRMLLLAMGRDSTGGVLEYDKKQQRLVADLDLHALAAGYSNQERLMADIAGQLGGELRVNPMWSFLGRPVTVHSQGGCPMSDDAATGVTDPTGRVHGTENLYVLDGSILCQSVGVNPSATIAAIAERNILLFIESTVGPDWVSKDTAGARQYRSHLELAEAWRKRAKTKKWRVAPPLSPHSAPSRVFVSNSVGIEFQEAMEGYYAPTQQDPDLPGAAARDAEYRRLEAEGTPRGPLRVDLHVSHANVSAFLEDERHELAIDGWATLALPGRTEAKHAVRGRLELLVQKLDEDLDDEQAARREAHKRYAPDWVQLRKKKARASGPPARFMNYHLDLVGTDVTIDGYKRISDKPGLGAYRDVSCLYVKLKQRGTVFGAGAVHIDVFEFLSKQIPSIKASGTTDKARLTWATQSFVRYFFGSLQRIYVSEVSSMFNTVLRGDDATFRGAHP